MQKMFSAVIAATFLAGTVSAGALTLQIDDAKSNRDAMAKKAIVVAHITACHSPEKTNVSATAEGIVDGRRRTIPLTVIKLSGPGTFGVAHEWPRDGLWTVKMIATNPDYRGYATSIVVPVRHDAGDRATTKVFYHAASADEIDSVLRQAALE